MKQSESERACAPGHQFRPSENELVELISRTFRTPALRKLAPREKEVARAVYLSTRMTATEVQSALSTPISNAAVRSMLNRLVSKGVLRRQLSTGKFFYSPALMLPDIQDRALQRIAQDYFEGSIKDAASRLVRLVKGVDPDWTPPTRSARTELLLGRKE